MHGLAVLVPLRDSFVHCHRLAGQIVDGESFLAASPAGLAHPFTEILVAKQLLHLLCQALYLVLCQ